MPGWLRSVVRQHSNSGQVVVASLVALLLGAATFIAGLAAEKWQEGSKEELRWSMATLETLRFVYNGEAPHAFSIAEAVNRADAMENFKGQDPGGVISFEARTAREFAQQRFHGLNGTNALVDEQYSLPGGGFAIAKRLGDLRKEDPLANNLADAKMSEGDRLTEVANILALLCAPIVLVWVALQALANARRNRTFGSPRPLSDDVGIMPQPWAAQPRRRKLTAAALAAWILLTLMPAAVLHMSAAGERAGAESQRLATSVTTSALASNIYTTYALQAKLMGTDMALDGLARQFTALDPRDTSQEALGQAEEIASEQWEQVSATMSRLPTEDDGVDSGLITAMASTPEDWNRAGEQQEAVSERAAQASLATTWANLSLALAALAASSLSLVLVTSNPPKFVRNAALLILLGAAVSGGAGFIIYL